MKSNKALAVGLGLMLGLAGCGDNFLTTTPPAEISEEVFWQDGQDAVLAVNAIYRYLWDGRGLFGLEAATDNTLTHFDYLYTSEYSQGTHDANTGWGATLWRRSYEAIRAANTVRANIDEIPEWKDPDLRERLKGEARFMRAYHYTYLVNLFGDVPLVLEPLALGEADVARTPRDEVVAQILDDLTYAASVLPLPANTDEGRATKGAALALKARAALYAASHSEYREGDAAEATRLYQIAAGAAKAVMDLGVYCLHPNYRELFTYAGEGSCEVIFARQQLKDQYASDVFLHFGPRSAQGGSEVVPTRSIVDAYYMTDGLPVDESPLYDSENPYANRDPRLYASVLYPGAMFLGKVYNSRPDSPTPDRLGSTQWATSTGYNLLKYIDPADADAIRNSGIDFILIRYADVLLMYAEAKIELGEIDAPVYEAINQVRARVDMPPVEPGKSQAQLREIVRHERRVELAFEGLRLFDIRRWGIADEVFPGEVYGINVVENGVRQPYLVPGATRFFDPARDYLWPIPQRELDINSNLTQNPGY